MVTTELASRMNGTEVESSTALALFPEAATTVEVARRHWDGMRSLVKSLLVEGLDGDYAHIPGTGDKDTLLKPGAEKLMTFYGLAPILECVREIEVYDGPPAQEASGSLPARPYFAFRYVCRAVSKRTGQVVATCEGEANTLEKRALKMTAFDARNATIKIAEKRALVGVALIACAASSLFTQDIEEMETGERRGSAQRPAGKAAEQKRACPTCSGGMTLKSGTGKNNRPWTAWMCDKGKQGCAQPPIWVDSAQPPAQPEVIDGEAREAAPMTPLVKEWWPRVLAALGDQGWTGPEAQAWGKRNVEALGKASSKDLTADEWEVLLNLARSGGDAGDEPPAEPADDEAF